MDQDGVREWLAPMPVGKIWGVGRKSVQVFGAMGIRTIGDLQTLPAETLLRKFGKHGESLLRLAQGIDSRPVCNGDACKSISREHTFPFDSPDREVWRSMLFTLTQDVSRRARRLGAKGSTVFITWRRHDFSRHSRQCSLPQPTNVAKRIFEEAYTLLRELDEPVLRLLGVGITGLDTVLQTDLFADEDSTRGWEASEQAMDILADRFGGSIIRKGSEIRSPGKPGTAHH
jgi:DNA polymerase-4